jgi:WAS protein family, member 1
MVFVKREIPPAQRLNRIELVDVPPAKVAQVTNQANLAGIITQMSYLTKYANEMFTTLVGEATETFQRIKSLSDRAEKINSTAAKVEAYFGGNQAQILLQMNNATRSEFTAQNPEQHQHLTVQSRPLAVTAFYNDECAPPPALHLLDSCTKDGKPCLVKYTHPQFFFEKWIEEQQKQVELLKAERKKRREERAARRANQKDSNAPAKVIRKLRKVRYDPQTGQKIIEEEEESVEVVQGSGGGGSLAFTGESSMVAPPTAAPSSSDKGKSSKSSSSKDKDKGKSKGDRKSKSRSEANPNAGSGMMPGTSIVMPDCFPFVSCAYLAFFPPRLEIPPPPSNNAPAPPSPRNPTPSAYDAPAPPPPPGGSSAYDAPAPPPPPPSGGGPAPPPPPPPPAGGPAAPPPPPVGGPAPPPPPPLPSSGGGGMGGGLLDAIRQGADLKRATPAAAAEKPVDTRSSLLENIRGGISLKSAQNRELKSAAPPKEDVHAMSVAEILARRVAIQGNSDSEGDEDDGDWDDY